VKKKTNEDAMKAIEEARWREEALRIDAMSDEEVDRDLREAGGDPEKIRREGAALAARLDWQARAQARLDEVRALAGTVRKTKLSREDMLAKVNAARNDPRFKKPVGALFRKRTPEDATDAELEAFLEAIDLLGKIEE